MRAVFRVPAFQTTDWGNVLCVWYTVTAVSTHYHFITVLTGKMIHFYQPLRFSQASTSCQQLSESDEFEQGQELRPPSTAGQLVTHLALGQVACKVLGGGEGEVI